MSEQRYRARLSLGYYDSPDARDRAVFEAQSKLGTVASPEARTEAIAPDLVYETPRPASRIAGASVTFGALGDTHLCSRYERLDILDALYDAYAGAGITDVYHTGNYIDGEARFNFSDIHTHGLDNQLVYFAEKYPKRAGISTHFIAGDDHEGWYQQRNDINIGEHSEDIARRNGRTDLHYLGYMESDVSLLGGLVKLRLIHAGGGSGAAISLTSQRIVDSYHEREKPHILLVGHYHKSEYLPDYKGVHIVQTGAVQEQTPFMRKKRLAAHLGGWIVKVTVSPDGGLRVGAEFLSFAHRAWVYR
jgi:hypothetical protein